MNSFVASVMTFREKGTVQEHRLERLAGDGQRARRRRMKMAHAHRIGALAMNLRMDPPFQRDESAGVFDDGPVDVVDKDVLGPNRALLGPGAGLRWSVATRTLPENR
jgi:hypothetical protein